MFDVKFGLVAIGQPYQYTDLVLCQLDAGALKLTCALSGAGPRTYVARHCSQGR